MFFTKLSKIEEAKVKIYKSPLNNLNSDQSSNKRIWYSQHHLEENVKNPSLCSDENDAREEYQKTFDNVLPQEKPMQKHMSVKEKRKE